MLVFKIIKKIHSLYRVFALFDYNFKCIINYIRLNYFSSNVHRYNGRIYVYPNVTFVMSKTSVIELYGDLVIGLPITARSKTCSRVIMNDYSRICVNKRCEFLEGCDIQMLKNGILTVDTFHSNIDLEVLCGCQIRLIGEVTAGRHVRLKDYNGHNVSYGNYPFSKSIIVENHVWLCSGSIVNPGCYIQTGSVIADNSNVITNIPAYSFVQGNPAKVIGNNISFKM